MVQKYGILIAEDDRFLREVLVNEFEDEKIFEVFQARNGEEAIAVALDKKPDIILLDLIMPELDGLSVLGKLRTDKWGKNAQVIVLTSLTDVDMIGDVTEKNVHDYLVKTDWRLEDVVRKVKERLNIA